MCFSGHRCGKSYHRTQCVLINRYQAPELLPKLTRGIFNASFQQFFPFGFRGGLMFRRAICTGLIILAAVASAEGQSPAARSDAGEKQVHWHKYVNHRYGFSFWYPDTYTPAPLPPVTTHASDYAKWSLLLLRRRDNPDACIWVGISPEPFRLYPGAGDVLPSRQLIGLHVFYGGMGGSMGVGFNDFYDLNLKGKTLRFAFGPDDGVNPNEETKQLEPKLLKTFRTF